MSSISNIIDQSPYGEDCKKELRKLIPDFQTIADMGYGKVERIRNNLHNMRSGKHVLVMGALFVINRIIRLNKDEPDNHLISDHAFCMGLSRYLGYDLACAKDAMLKLARQKDWRFAYGANGSIKTFLPPKTA